MNLQIDLSGFVEPAAGTPSDKKGSSRVSVAAKAGLPNRHGTLSLSQWINARESMQNVEIRQAPMRAYGLAGPLRLRCPGHASPALPCLRRRVAAGNCASVEFFTCSFSFLLSGRLVATMPIPINTNELTTALDDGLSHGAGRPRTGWA